MIPNSYTVKKSKFNKIDRHDLTVNIVSYPVYWGHAEKFPVSDLCVAEYEMQVNHQTMPVPAYRQHPPPPTIDGYAQLDRQTTEVQVSIYMNVNNIKKEYASRYISKLRSK